MGLIRIWIVSLARRQNTSKGALCIAQTELYYMYLSENSAADEVG